MVLAVQAAVPVVLLVPEQLAVPCIPRVPSPAARLPVAPERVQALAHAPALLVPADVLALVDLALQAALVW